MFINLDDLKEYSNFIDILYSNIKDVKVFFNLLLSFIFMGILEMDYNLVLDHQFCIVILSMFYSLS
jgi:hypothetical protein